MQRDTRLDGLPLATVVLLSTLLLVWAARGGSIGTVRAEDLAEIATETQLAGARIESNRVRVEPLPWGGRTVGELLERVLDPATRPVPQQDTAQPEEDDDLEGMTLEHGPHGPRPFVLTSADGTVVLAEGLLVDGLPEGPWVFRQGGGLLRARGSFVGGAPDGLWEAWHDSGARRAALEYDEGAPAGRRVDWWPSGAKALEGSYVDGLRDGMWLTWHENGALRSQGTYVDGLREGTWLEWHPNGMPASQSEYAQGRREGLFRAWYPDRGLAQQGWYVEGRREGEWAFLERDGGRDRRTGFYVSGVLQRK